MHHDFNSNVHLLNKTIISINLTKEKISLFNFQLSHEASKQMFLWLFFCPYWELFRYKNRNAKQISQKKEEGRTGFKDSCCLKIRLRVQKVSNKNEGSQKQLETKFHEDFPRCNVFSRSLHWLTKLRYALQKCNTIWDTKWVNGMWNGDFKTGQGND